MSLRRSSSHAALGAGEGDQVQLFDLPAPWRTLGVLRVRNSSHRRTSGEYGRVHLGRQDTSQCTLQELRVRHALGTTCPRARRQARGQFEQLRSAPSRVRPGTPVRWSGHLEIHRLSGTAAVAYPFHRGDVTIRLRLLAAAPHVKRQAHNRRTCRRGV